MTRARKRKWRGAVAGLAALFGTALPAQAPLPVGELGAGAPAGVIEIAIVLDTSGSMKPLIEAARVGLWDIVNEIARRQPAPELRVALIGYGGRAEERARGWVTVRSPLTADLDRVSEQLFALTLGGGTEYVARALSTAVETLAWSPPGPETLRLIFLAGNEPADQDPEVDLLGAGRAADAGGIEVYAIYCGQASDEHAESWRGLAQASRGRFTTLALGAAASLAETPVDRELARLGEQLNGTFVELAGTEDAGRAALVAQDRNVEELSLAAAAARAETKAGALYRPSWDLVNAVAAGRLNLEQVEEAKLPPALRALLPAERQAWIEGVQTEREQLRERILALGEERRRHLDESAHRQGAAGARTFEAVVREALREALEERGLESGSETEGD
ncbi:MAG: VWA domain-containing protein [Thermoanaerobaculia bacterium]|nr:MAG: VWA domain-containing protein [Thermoanaerobaculia bacterium]